VAARAPARAPGTLGGLGRSGGGGNTQGDPDRFTQLIGDVSSRLFDALPDETWFYPGHGNDSTLGVERPHLAEWRDRGW
jgi:glyoxylase-like metal-dependent hydrolase (beta-lactamase superfamily II)